MAVLAVSAMASSIPQNSTGAAMTAAVAKKATSEPMLSWPSAASMTPTTSAGSERELGEQGDHHGEGGMVLGLGDLGLPQLLGLLVEVLQCLAAAAERLQHADAVHRFLHRGGEVAGLVLAAAGHLAEPASGTGSRRS